MGKIATFFHFPVDEKRLALEAIFLCAWVRLVMWRLPFRKYVSLLGKPVTDGKNESMGNPHFSSPQETTSPETVKLQSQVGVAVQRASRNVPWSTRCFVEAIVAKRMLKRRGIPCTVFLGLKKVVPSDDDEIQEELSAHAWSVCGDFIVTGRQGVKLKEYTVVSSFR